MLQRTDKDCIVFLQRYDSTLMWNDFFLDAATNLKERKIILVEPVMSLKLVCNLKHLSCTQLHNIVKGESTF